MSSIAVINAGSSSIKFAVFQAASTPSLLLRGQIEGIGATPRAKLSDPGGKLLVEESMTRLPDQAARSIVGSEGLSLRVCQPSTLRIVICPEAKRAQNNMAAVSAEGRTV
jgi:hypothetical protein